MSSSIPMGPLPSNPNDNASNHMTGSTLAVTSLAFLSILIRFSTRSILVKAWGWDDWIMGLAMVVSIFAQVFIIIGVNHGAGRHVGDVPSYTYQKGLLYNFVTQQLLLLGICIVKMSVGFALLRIAARRVWKVVIIVVMVFMAAYTVVAFITNFFFCQPFSALWDGTFATCWPPSTLQALAFTHAGLNVVTDLLFAVGIPVPMLWKLQMNRRTKFAVLLVLSLGVFVCLASILKVPEILNFGKRGDFLWYTKDFTIWFMAELNTGIIAGSMPAMKPLFRIMLDKSHNLTSKRFGGPAYGNRQSMAVMRTQRWRNRNTTNTSGDPERLDSGVQFDEAETNSTMSQRKLVFENDVQAPIPLGVIQKVVVTTVTPAPEHEGSSTGRRNNWDM